MLAERNRLLSEPDTGDEFLRSCMDKQRTIRLLTTEVEQNESEPIKFSTSGAARKTVAPVMTKTNTEIPWYQPYSVVCSVAVFLIYFCVLREENNVDLEFNKTLYERIHGLEKEQLLQSYRYNKENGKSVDDIEKRLKEIEEDELKTL
ncbi:Uncharacterized protein OBRU01_07405 [Operophtera brumata]|uniref:Uncharacterized protein n=1 Tax=Operophtera brumata TaxID=104452 RepID=A0A0L7L3N1_OPEBR|nr:Uncharacterized protein OBRU01_07405 [Operophtera brumata]